MGRITEQASSMQAPSPTTNFLHGEDEEGSEIHPLNAELKKCTEAQFAFGKQLRDSMAKAFEYLEISESDQRQHRLYDPELIELTRETSVILLLPSAETVCSLADNRPALNLHRNDLLGLPLQIFETIHLSSYHPDLLTTFYRVTLHLEIELAVAKQHHREAFSKSELGEAQDRLTSLLDRQQTLEDSWKSMRWLLDVLSVARNKNVHCGVTFEHLNDWYSSQKNFLPDDSNFGAKSGDFNSQQETLSQINASHPYDPTSSSSASGAGTLMAKTKGISRTPTTRSDPLEFNLAKSGNKENEVRNFPKMPQVPGTSADLRQTSSSYSSLTFSQHSTNSSVSSNEQQQPQVQQPQYENLPSEPSSVRSSFDPRIAQSGRFSNAVPVPASRSSRTGTLTSGSESPEPNVLQVFAAYETGLASGTSVKLNVTHSTSAREVIDLVIKQLNMAVILKGRERPIYENDKLKNFCLVAVIGNRERCLRDDFKPLNLQNPWKKGKLFVRMKNDLLAAIEHISRHSTML